MLKTKFKALQQTKMSFLTQHVFAFGKILRFI